MTKAISDEQHTFFGVDFHMVKAQGGLPGKPYNVFDVEAKKSFIEDTKVVCAVGSSFVNNVSDLNKYLSAKNFSNKVFLDKAKEYRGGSYSEGDFFEIDLSNEKSASSVKKVICVRFPYVKLDRDSSNVQKKLLEFGQKFYNELKRAGVEKITIPSSFLENQTNNPKDFPLHIMTGFMRAMNADKDKKKLTDVYCCSPEFYEILNKAEAAATNATVVVTPPADDLKARIHKAIIDKHEQYVAQQKKSAVIDESKFKNKAPLVIFTNSAYYREGGNPGMDPDKMAASYSSLLGHLGRAEADKNIFIFDNKSGSHWNFDGYKTDAKGTPLKAKHYNVSARGNACASFSIIDIIAADENLSKLPQINQVLDNKDKGNPVFTASENASIKTAFTSKNSSNVDPMLARKFVYYCALKAMKEGNVSEAKRSEVESDIMTEYNYTDGESMEYALKGLGIKYSRPDEIVNGPDGGINGLEEYVRSVFVTGGGRGQEEWIADIYKSAKVVKSDEISAAAIIKDREQLLADLKAMIPSKSPSKKDPSDADKKEVKSKVRAQLEQMYNEHRGKPLPLTVIIKPEKYLEKIFGDGEGKEGLLSSNPDLFYNLAKGIGLKDGYEKTDKYKCFLDLVATKSSFVKLLEGMVVSEGEDPVKKKKPQPPVEVVTAPALALSAPVTYSKEDAKKSPEAAKMINKINQQGRARQLVGYEITSDDNKVSLEYRFVQNGEDVAVSESLIIPKNELLKIENGKAVIDNDELRCALNEIAARVPEDKRKIPSNVVHYALAIQAYQLDLKRGGKN